MGTPFKSGDVVEIRTRWPWATRRVAIIKHLRGMYYMGRALPPYSELWRESPPNGEKFYLNVSSRVIKSAPALSQ